MLDIIVNFCSNSSNLIIVLIFLNTIDVIDKLVNILVIDNIHTKKDILLYINKLEIYMLPT